jgi:hypothetical protein
MPIDPESGTIRSSRDSGVYHIWWLPVSEIYVGDLVYMEPTGLCYEVTARWNGVNPLQFAAKMRPDLSTPRTQNVDPSVQEINLVFVDTTVKFAVLKTSAPPQSAIKNLPT